MLHLIYRLVVQPNTYRAHAFADAFIACGGVETLLVLLQREAKTGDISDLESITPNKEDLVSQGPMLYGGSGEPENSEDDEVGYSEKELGYSEKIDESARSDSGGNSVAVSQNQNIERMVSVSDGQFLKNLGGISLSISADSARNNVYNVDRSDGIVAGIIGLLGALVASGHLKFDSCASDINTNILETGLDGGGTMFTDKVSLLLFALHKAFQAAPKRLMTSNVYAALLGASV